MRVLSALERHGVEYVLVGSMALAAQGIVRATRDMDIFVSAEESNIIRLKAAWPKCLRTRRSMASPRPI